MTVTRFGRALLTASVLLVVGACSDDGGEAQDAASTPTTEAAAEPPATEAPAPATEPAAVEVSDAAASTAVPSAIVSLSPTATEILFAIGAGDQVIAVDSASTFPTDAPMTELSGFEPNIEAIAAFEPDLVVLSDDMNNVVAGLAALDIAVVQQPAAATLADTYAQIVELGDATGHAEEAAALVDEMQNDIAGILAEAGSLGDGRSVYHELDPTYYSVTSATFIGEVYSAFGLANIADAASKPDEDFGYPQLTAEYIVSSDPDLVMLADTKCCQVDAASVAARPGWSGLSALGTSGVIELDDDIASRWGPRVVEQYRVIAKALAEISG